METTTKKLTKKQENEQDKARAKEDLLFELNALPGEKKVVATICTHVSRSGMSRQIKVIINGHNMSRQVATLLDRKYKNDAVVVGGCGMDMGFHLVYTLSYVLFKENNTTGRNPGYTLEQKRL